MPNVVPLRPARADWTVLTERGHELGVLAVAIEHLRQPDGTPFALSPGALATLERMAERLKGELDRMLKAAT